MEDNLTSSDEEGYKRSDGMTQRGAVVRLKGNDQGPARKTPQATPPRGEKPRMAHSKGGTKPPCPGTAQPLGGATPGTITLGSVEETTAPTPTGVATAEDKTVGRRRCDNRQRWMMTGKVGAGVGGVENAPATL